MRQIKVAGVTLRDTIILGRGVLASGMLGASYQIERGVLALVDDDAPLLHALTFAFETRGFAVDAFANAELALAATAQDEWRCLILDQRLPGMSGLELLSRLRAALITAPAVLITSNPSGRTRAWAAQAGVEIVEKPILDDVLVERVAALWQREVGPN